MSARRHEKQRRNRRNRAALAARALTAQGGPATPAAVNLPAAVKDDLHDGLLSAGLLATPPPRATVARSPLPVAVVAEMSRLRDLVKAHAAAQLAVERQVECLRRHHASWAAIGNALGVSRQAARQRYRQPE